MYIDIHLSSDLVSRPLHGSEGRERYGAGRDAVQNYVLIKVAVERVIHPAIIQGKHSTPEGLASVWALCCQKALHQTVCWPAGNLKTPYRFWGAKKSIQVMKNRDTLCRYLSVLLLPPYFNIRYTSFVMLLQSELQYMNEDYLAQSYLWQWDIGSDCVCCRRVEYPQI